MTSWRGTSSCRMGGAIWSASSRDMGVSASYLLFMDNHGLLSAAGQADVADDPRRSRVYVSAIADRLAAATRVGNPGARLAFARSWRHGDPRRHPTRP